MDDAADVGELLIQMQMRRRVGGGPGPSRMRPEAISSMTMSRAVSWSYCTPEGLMAITPPPPGNRSTPEALPR